MDHPARIQLRRTKGWRLPSGVVKVDRTTRWGNPFKVGKTSTHPETGQTVSVESPEQSIALFTLYLHTPQGAALARTAKHVLRGKHLACWCRVGEPCHGDILLAVANSLGPVDT